MATKSPSELPSPSHDGALPPAFVAQARAVVATNTSSDPSQVRHSEEWKEHEQIGERQTSSRSEAFYLNGVRGFVIY
jgi:hypothetical protein